MVGRVGSILIAGAAIVAGMAVQGDIDLDGDDHVIIRHSEKATAREDFGLRIDRIVDDATDGIDSRGDDDQPIEQNPVIRRQMVGAVAELIRAEVSLATLKDDEKLPKSVIVQAEQRRDAARLAVDRLADEAKAVSRDDREEIRDNLREEVRDAVRERVRG